MCCKGRFNSDRDAKRKVSVANKERGLAAARFWGCPLPGRLPAGVPPSDPAGASPGKYERPAVGARGCGVFLAEKPVNRPRIWLQVPLKVGGSVAAACLTRHQACGEAVGEKKGKSGVQRDQLL